MKLDWILKYEEKKRVIKEKTLLEGARDADAARVASFGFERGREIQISLA